MKVHIKFLSLAILILFFTSCESSKNKGQQKQVNEETKELAESMQEVKVEISGMTCEIGCARLIQSKLYKADGVKYARISFEDSSGVIRYDQNRISESEIKKVIERTAGGDLYSVMSMEQAQVLDSVGVMQ